jgi:hypothetical protein
MKSFAAFVVAVAALDENDLKFAQFLAKYNKQYRDMEEYQMRKANFMFTEAEIVRLNSSQKFSTHAHNFMSDFTSEEYNRLLGLKDIPPPDLSKFPTYRGSSAN